MQNDQGLWTLWTTDSRGRRQRPTVLPAKRFKPRVRPGMPQRDQSATALPISLCAARHVAVAGAGGSMMRLSPFDCVATAIASSTLPVR